MKKILLILGLILLVGCTDEFTGRNKDIHFENRNDAYLSILEYGQNNSIVQCIGYCLRVDYVNIIGKGWYNIDGCQDVCLIANSKQ